MRALSSSLWPKQRAKNNENKFEIRYFALHAIEFSLANDAFESTQKKNAQEENIRLQFHVFGHSKPISMTSKTTIKM